MQRNILELFFFKTSGYFIIKSHLTCFCIGVDTFYIDVDTFYIDVDTFYIEADAFFIGVDTFYIDVDVFYIGADALCIGVDPLCIDAEYLRDKSPVKSDLAYSPIACLWLYISKTIGTESKVSQSQEPNQVNTFYLVS